MAVIKSFTGDIANPIVDGRLEKSLSANALAKRLGLSRQYISRAEQGTYTSLNPDLKRWVAGALQISQDAVIKRYVVFQQANRQATVERIDPHKLSRNGSLEPGHVIFERWRSGYWTSPTQFAVAFCVHPDTVQKYEEGIQKIMPSVIRNALEETGLLDLNWEDDLLGRRTEATGAPLKA